MDPAIFDKNKSAYKLKNFGPLYYLNLDGNQREGNTWKTNLNIGR